MTDVFLKLTGLGLTTDQIAGVLEIIDADADLRKAKTRARVAKFRAKNKPETLRNATDDYAMLRNDSCAGVTRVSDNLQTKYQNGKKDKKERAAPAALSDLAAFKAELEQDANSEQVQAFAKHRKAKNGQNSAYSARLFRKDATACGLSISQAIDTAISRGWLTVKPEYLAGRNQQRATSPPRGRALEAYDEISRMKGWTGESEELSGIDEDVQRFPSGTSQLAGAVTDIRGGPDWRQ